MNLNINMAIRRVYENYYNLTLIWDHIISFNLSRIEKSKSREN